MNLEQMKTEVEQELQTLAANLKYLEGLNACIDSPVSGKTLKSLLETRAVLVGQEQENLRHKMTTFIRESWDWARSNRVVALKVIRPEIEDRILGMKMHVAADKDRVADLDTMIEALEDFKQIAFKEYDTGSYKDFIGWCLAAAGAFTGVLTVTPNCHIAWNFQNENLLRNSAFKMNVRRIFRMEVEKAKQFALTTGSRAALVATQHMSRLAACDDEYACVDYMTWLELELISAVENEKQPSSNSRLKEENAKLEAALINADKAHAQEVLEMKNQLQSQEDTLSAMRENLQELAYYKDQLTATLSRLDAKTKEAEQLKALVKGQAYAPNPEAGKQAKADTAAQKPAKVVKTVPANLREKFKQEGRDEVKARLRECLGSLTREQLRSAAAKAVEPLTV